MTHRIRLSAVALCALLGAFAIAAHAAAPQRTFVSGGGNDANPCSLASPCRSFTAAVTAVAAKGEVIVLDSAAYGTVTITKSVSLIAPSGIYAGVTVSAGDGITVNAPGGIVVLRRTVDQRAGRRQRDQPVAGGAAAHRKLRHFEYGCGRRHALRTRCRIDRAGHDRSRQRSQWHRR